MTDLSRPNVALTASSEGLSLDHLYVHPDEQGRCIGSAVLAIVFHEADTLGQPLRVAALRDSASNRFYQRHGFVFVEEGPWDLYYVRQPRRRARPSRPHMASLCTIPAESLHAG